MEILQEAMNDARQAEIEAEIAACTGCNQAGFYKRADCEDCIAAVDERLANRAPDWVLESNDEAERAAQEHRDLQGMAGCGNPACRACY